MKKREKMNNSALDKIDPLLNQRKFASSQHNQIFSSGHNTRKGDSDSHNVGKIYNEKKSGSLPGANESAKQQKR